MLIRLLKSQVDPNPAVRKRGGVGILHGGRRHRPHRQDRRGNSSQPASPRPRPAVSWAAPSFLDPPPANSALRPGEAVVSVLLRRWAPTRGSRCSASTHSGIRARCRPTRRRVRSCDQSAPEDPWVECTNRSTPLVVHRWHQLVAGQRHPRTERHSPVVARSARSDVGLHLDDVKCGSGNLVCTSREPESKACVSNERVGGAAAAVSGGAIGRRWRCLA